MKSALIRRVAPVALAVGIGVGAAGAGVGSASASETVPFGTCGITTTFAFTISSAPYNSSEPSVIWAPVSSFTCSGPNGVAKRELAFWFGEFITLNGQYVYTSDVSDATVREIAGLPA